MKYDIIDYKHHIRSLNPDLVGGKAYHLYLLRKNGMQVPPWLVLTKNVFEKSITKCKSELKELLSGIQYADTGQIPSICAQICELIKNVNIDELINHSLLREI